MGHWNQKKLFQCESSDQMEQSTRLCKRLNKSYNLQEKLRQTHVQREYCRYQPFELNDLANKYLLKLREEILYHGPTWPLRINKQ